MLPNVEVVISALLNPCHRRAFGRKLNQEPKMEQVGKSPIGVREQEHLLEFIPNTLSTDDCEPV